MIATATHVADTIELPPPRLWESATLVDALMARQSTREFSARPLDLATLSGLLWAAWGFNRPEARMRTAPSTHDAQEIDVYVVTAQGAYVYDARRSALDLVAPGDHRFETGLQEYAADAPVNLVYVADLSLLGDTSAPERPFYSALDTGFIAENVYLYCAATGLVCVVRSLVDRARLARVLALRPEQRVIAAHSIGHPKTLRP